ncbi:MAG: hypothetical protein KF774_05375 [Planctomyces sp.]|nr:hypothetical protein [Planctomyces sp.]
MPRCLLLLAALLLPVVAHAQSPEIDALKQQAEAAAQRRDETRAQLSDVEAQARTLEQTLARLKSDLEQTQKGLAESEAALKTQMEEEAKTAAARDESAKAAAVAVQALADAQKQADEANAAAAAAAQAAEAATAAVAAKTEALTGLQAMLATLQTGLAESGEQLAAVQTNLSAAQQAAAMASAEWLTHARSVESALRDAGQWVSFSAEIAPIFHQRCVACHNSRSSKGRLNMESYAALLKGGESGPAVQAGELSDSTIHQQIAEGLMPKDADPLTPEQAALIDKWIALGAPLDAGIEAALPLMRVMPRFPQPPAPEAYASTMPVTAIAFSPDGSLLATGGYHELLLWNPADQSLVRRIGNVAERVFDIDFHPDGSLVAIASGTPGQTGELKVFQTADGALVADLVVAEDALFGVAFSPDGSRLAGCGADRSLSVFAVDGWKPQLRLEDHADWVLDVAWSPDGSKLVTASRDKTSKVFNSESGDAIVTFNTHGDVVYGAGFLADGAHIVSAGRDKRLRVWTADEAKQVREIGGFGGDVLHIRVLADGRVASGGGDNHVRLHNSADGGQIRDFAGHADWVYSVDVHPATGRMASGSYDGEVRVWNIENGETTGRWLAAPGYPANASAAN